jgi:heat shock protein HtpX
MEYDATMMLRIFLFLATNIAVMVVLTLALMFVGPRLGLEPGSFGMLVLMGGVVGFAGAFISLAMSKWMAKRSMGVQVIEQPSSDVERWLHATVQRQAQAAGIGMPEVGIFDSPVPNAFATGMSRDSALVAVSTGLLRSMNKDEVEAVLGHEVAHVANGDMITMALIQGVVNTFVFVLARVVGNIVDKVVLKNERGHGIGYFVTVILAEIVLGILASMIVMWFSRQREFRADAGGARLAGRMKMVAALEALRRGHDPEPLPDQMAAFGIAGGRPAGWKKLFMSHPPLEERIEALKASREV